MLGVKPVFAIAIQRDGAGGGRIGYGGSHRYPATLGKAGGQVQIVKRVVATSVENDELVAYLGLFHAIEYLIDLEREIGNLLLGRQLGINRNQVVLVAVLDAVAGIVKHRRRCAVHLLGEFHRGRAHGQKVGIRLEHHLETEIL